jgi:hypothetical protein
MRREVEMPEKRRFIGLKMDADRRKHAIASLSRAEKHNKEVADRISRARAELNRIMAPRRLQ